MVVYSSFLHTAVFYIWNMTRWGAFIFTTYKTKFKKCQEGYIFNASGPTGLFFNVRTKDFCMLIFETGVPSIKYIRYLFTGAVSSFIKYT